jgi:lactoylglutathione lyase
MATQTKIEANVEQAIPFFRVTSMEMSLRFYVDGLGFEITKKWTPDGDGKIRWCWLQHGSAALMLQEYRKEHHPNPGRSEGKLGLGVSICFQCKDMRWLFTKISSPAGSRRRGHSSETRCG